MEQIIPNKSFNLDRELEQLRKENKRIMVMDYITNALMFIVGIGVIILIWSQLNTFMADRAYNEGYERGYEQSQWDYIDEKIKSEDYGTIRMEPTTDAEIWNAYHDCNMYGLPTYARQYCEAKEQ